MRRFSIAALGLLFAAMFSISANAQTGAAQAGAGKIGLVNSSMFGDPKAGGGITKFKNALNALETEFKPVDDEIKGLQTRYQTLGGELQKLQAATAPVSRETLKAKADEVAALEVSLKRKDEDAKARYATRYDAVVGPVTDDILRKMNDFAKQKGYALILDGPKLLEAQILMGFDEKVDITAEFMAFYNAIK